MSNPFDQFDERRDNPFDQFDTAPTERKGGIGHAVDQAANALVFGWSSPFGAAANAAGMVDPDLKTIVPRAIQNAPQSAGKLVSGLAHAVMNPTETLEGLGALAKGVGAKIAISKDAPAYKLGEQYLPVVDAALDALKERYGGYGAIKNTIATDPIGVAFDASMVMPGFGLGKVAATVAPVANAARLAGGAGKLTGDAVAGVLGRTTGTGGGVIKEAARAGFKGGDTAKVFRENMRGSASADDLVRMGDDALGGMRNERAAAYNTGMEGVRADATILDMTPIINDFAKATGIDSFNGVSTNAKTANIQKEVANVLTEWRVLSPAEFHTPAGLDALKKKIGSLREGTEAGSASRKFVDQVYHSVKAQIEKQAPEYAKTMKAYEEASDKLRELQKTFSLSENATADTAARKLLSTARNNVTSNFNYRAELLKELGKHQPNLPAAIAGQTLSSLQPRGLVANAAGTLGLGATVANPYLIPAIPAFMPRVVGEAAYGAGRAAAPIDRAWQAVSPYTRPGVMGLLQSGRADEELRRRGLVGLLNQ